MKGILKRTAAALLSLTMLGTALTALPEGTLRLNTALTASAAAEPGSVEKQGSMLVLHGSITSAMMKDYRSDTSIKSIVADETTVMPTDCQSLICGGVNSYLGDYWKNLERVDLSAADFSNVTNMGSFFAGCLNLKHIDLSGIDTSKVEGMNSMFYATQISYIDLSSFDTSKVRRMSYMFQDCTELVYLDLSSFSSASLKEAERMFYGCENLKRIFATYSFRYYTQKNTEGMFGNCYSLVGGNGTTYDTSKDADSYDGLYAWLSDKAGETCFYTRRCAKLEFPVENGTVTPTLILMGNVNKDLMTSLYRDTDGLRRVIRVIRTDGTAVLPADCTSLFEGYENLVNVDFHDIDSSNVTTMQAMFKNCPELFQVDFSGMDTSNVTYMYQMFYDCEKLKTVTVGEGWVTPTNTVTGLNEIFYHCYNIVGEKGTTYDRTDEDWSSHGQYAHVDGGTADPGYFWFRYCEMDYETCTLTIHGNITKEELGRVLTDTTVKHVIAAPGTVFPEDSQTLFMSCKDAVSMDLSAADTSNVTNMSSMFSGLTKLETLDITGWDTSNVTNMRRMFYQDSKLKTVYIGSGWTTEAVQAEGSADYSENMLYGCTSLVGTLGNTVGSITNKARANLDSFEEKGVFSAKSISYNYTTQTLYLDGEIDGALLACFDSEDAMLNAPVIWTIYANEGTVLPQYCRYLFSGFENVRWISLGNADVSQVTDMEGMFNGLENLESVSFGASFDVSRVTSMKMMFMGCTKLTVLDLSSFCTNSLMYVSGMFANCSSLKTVYIRPEIWKLRYGAAVYHNGMFTGCTSIVGANGTVFDSAHTNKEYARLDINGQKGYFSARCYTFSDGKLVLYGQVVFSEITNFPDKSAVTEIFAHPGTVLPENCDGLFGFYSNVTKIDLNYADSSNVTNMDKMFQWCESLKTLVIDKLDTSNVTTMREMFAYCTALKSLSLTNFNTENVTDMFAMFDGCSALTKLNLSAFSTAKVTNMYEMFRNCSALTSIDLSGFDTGNVVDTEDMFKGCSELTSLDLSSFNTANARWMESMFEDCTKLKTIYVSVSLWSTASVTAGHGDDMFKGCTALVGARGTAYNAEHVDCEYARPDYPDEPGYLSYYCYDFDQETGTLTLHDMLNQPQLHSLQLNYSSKITSVTALPGTVFPPDSSKMFEYFEKVVSFDLSNADTRQVTNMARMFYDCKNLTELNISSFDTSHVTDMSYMFESCEKMTALDLSFFDTQNVTNMAHMFAYDRLMTDLNLSSFDTSNVTDMKSMFKGCSNLTALDLSAFSNSSLTNASYMFFNCTNLTTIFASDRWLPDQDFSTDYMFYVCNALVGGNGTQCNGSSDTDVSLVRIDEPEHPGYFTRNPLFSLSVSHNIALNNNIGVIYYVPAASLEGFENVRLTVQKEIFNANGSVVTRKSETVTTYRIEDSGYGNEYVFEYNNIAAKEMGSKLYATVCAEKDGKTYSSQIDVYSVLTYATNKLNKAGTKADMKALLVDMLNYGAAAQTYFNYNTGNLANSTLTAAQLELGTSTSSLNITSDFTETAISSPKAQFTGKNLLLGNNVTLVFYMTFDSTVNTDNVVLQLSYTTVKGERVTKNVPFSQMKLSGYADGEYEYDFDTVRAKDSCQPVTAKILVNGTQISNTITYSIQTYAYNKLNNPKTTEKLKTIIEALMVYCKSAETYFINHS